MQVYGTNAPGAPARTSTVRRTAAGTFTVATEEMPTATGAALTSPLAGIETLLTLQGVEDPTERRKRATKRARTALDTLDELKLGLLGGNLDPGTMQRLVAVAHGLKADSGDERLDAVIGEISLRVGVELAKAGLG